MGTRQSFCYPMYTSEDLEDKTLFARASKIGYEAVEFWGRDQFSDYRAVFDAAVQSGLRIASMIGHGSLPDGMNKPDNHARIEREIYESIDIATEYDIPGIICFSGNRNHGQSDLEGMRECAKVLRRIAPRAEQKNVNLNVELLNSKVDHPDYQCDRSDWGYALCDMVDNSRVKVLFDIYHMQIMEGDVIRSMIAGMDWIGHVHTAGNPGRNDLDDFQELNYRGICRAISEAGYDLFVGHEFKPKSDVIEALRGAFTICDI
jgi:hydroxypyruvate isomerase